MTRGLFSRAAGVAGPAMSLFGSAQGDPNVRAQIEQGFARAGHPSPFSPDGGVAPAMRPMPQTPTVADTGAPPQTAPQGDGPSPVDRIKQAFSALQQQQQAPQQPAMAPQGGINGGGSFMNGNLSPQLVTPSAGFGSLSGAPQAMQSPPPDDPAAAAGIPGQNPALGDMADPSQLGGNLQARQIMDPASGQMMNDYFTQDPMAALKLLFAAG